MLEKEGLDLAVWTASIHYNTDNIHVHVATVEPYPLREVMMYQGQAEYRGKFKLKNLEMCKSSIVNEIMHTKEVNQKINHIIRDRIVKDKQNRVLAEAPEFRDLFLQLYQRLPNVSTNLMNYDNSIMHSVRPLIDSISKMYLEKYHAKDYKEFKEITQRQSELYTQAYGIGQSNRSYAEGKEDDLLKRLGNTIIKEIKRYDSGMNQNIKKYVEDIANSNKGNKIGPGLRIESESNISSNSATIVEHETEAVNEDEINFIIKARQTKKVINSELQKELDVVEHLFYQNETDNTNGMVKKYGDWFKDLKKIREDLNPEQGKEIDTDAVMSGIERGVKEGNPFVLHLKAELQQVGRVLEIDQGNAQKYFAQVFEIFIRDEPELSLECETKKGFRFDDYVQYRIGKQYNRGTGIELDNSKAAYWFEKSGTSYARYSLANLYFHGEGVEQDFEMALDLYQSVDKNAFSYLKCAEMYEAGQGCDISKELAEEYYKKAFEQFVSDEAKRPDDLFEYQLGKMLYSGIGCSPNLASSIEYLEMAAEKKNVHAEYLVSKIYLDEGIEEKIPLAIERLTKLAETGNQSNAQYALGKVYIDYDNIEYYDMKKGIEYLHKASEQEHEYAQYQLGKLYTNPELEIYDLHKGIEYLEASAEQGNQYAEYHLGKLYTNPELEIYDLGKGIEYLGKSAEQGNQYAEYYLGKLYTNSELEIYDLDRGIRYLEKSAKQGNQYAEYHLGKLYTDPDMQVYNLNQGVEYLERAFVQGNESAQYRLGKLYMNSELEVYDSVKGIEYLEGAKANGNEAAQYFLGCRYLDRESAVYNPEKGIEYIRGLAEKGSDYAQMKLGCEYLKGENVQRDVEGAKTWLSKAAEQGNEASVKILNDIDAKSFSQRNNRSRGELDKALCRLQRSFEEERRINMQTIRQQELEYDMEAGNEL